MGDYSADLQRGIVAVVCEGRGGWVMPRHAMPWNGSGARGGLGADGLWLAGRLTGGCCGVLAW